MANKKVSELSTYASVLSTDYVVIDRTAGTGNAQLSAISDHVLSLPVITTKLANRSITANKIGLKSVTSSELADDCITPPKLDSTIVKGYGGLKVDTSGLSVETKIHSSISINNSYLPLEAANSIVGIISNTSITIKIPTNSHTPFDIGTNIVIYQEGTGQVTVAGEAGVTLLSNNSKFKLTDQNSCAALFKIDTNTWLLGGDLTS